MGGRRRTYHLVCEAVERPFELVLDLQAMVQTSVLTGSQCAIQRFAGIEQALEALPRLGPAASHAALLSSHGTSCRLISYAWRVRMRPAAAALSSRACIGC